MNKTAVKVLKILENHLGEAVSGEKIAEEVGITRSAVWKAINLLKGLGYEIKSTTNRGYELSKDNDILTSSGILAALQTEGGEIFKTEIQIEVVEEVDSTNAVMKAEARKGGEEGRILVAKKQSGGKGRLGRSFFSPKNGLYLSMILRPKISFMESLMLTTMAATAVVDAIREVTGIETGIKWVNDIYMGGRKVCGILTEAEADVENGMLSYAVVGIGINITEPEEGVPEELKDIAGFLYGKDRPKRGIKTALVAAIIKNYFSYYEKLPKKSFMEGYRNNQILIGKEVDIMYPDKRTKALVHGVDEEARLLVEYENGEKEALFTGEVSVREVGTRKKNPPRFSGRKKGLLTFFLAFLLFSVTGCAEKKESKATELSQEREEKKGYCFTVGEETFVILSDPSEQIERLSLPGSKFEVPACANLGEDIVYTFNGFHLTLNKTKDCDDTLLYSILLTNDAVETKEGLRIGDKEEKMRSLYGKAEPVKGAYTYPKGEMELNIIVKEGIVTSIEYRVAKEYRR